MRPRPGVALRDVVDDDVEVFFAHQSEPGASEMAAFPVRDRATHVAAWKRRMADPAIAARTIVSDGEVVGYVLSWPETEYREVGYWIGKGYWGRGIATAALSQFLSVVTERPLHAYVVPTNLGSRRVLIKCGFQETGRFVVEGNTRLAEYSLGADASPVHG